MEFKPYPKTPRLRRTVVITEKIDGTNGQLQFDEYGNMLVGSRKRQIFPEGTVKGPTFDMDGKYVKGTDNYGFAKWAYDNKWELFKFLGEGTHYGEWAGKGVQRGYGLDEKRFFLFNVERFGPGRQDIPPALGAIGLSVVPVLLEGDNDTANIDDCMEWLAQNGSAINGGTAEGIIVYHTASRTVAKVTFNQDKGKWSE